MKLYLLFLSLFLNCINLEELKNAEPMHYLTGVIVASAKGTQTTASDQASFQIQGTLKDSSGNPIANAILSLGISQSIVSREAVTTSTTTDANGNYTLNLKMGNFSVKVTNSSGVEIGSFRMNATSTTTKPEISATSGNMSFVVNSITSPSPINPVTVAPSNLSYSSSTLNLTVGTAMTSLSPTVTGIVTSYSVSPAFPGGLSLNSSTGVISGTPTSAQSAIGYVITASNTGGSSTFLVNIAVNNISPSNLRYRSSSMSLTLGSPIEPLIPVVTGDVLSYSIIPSLPSGLIFNSSTGVISGTPTLAQSSVNYTVTASNNSGSTNYLLSIGIIAVVIRDWATFTDMLDGTIRVEVKNGIWGGQAYSDRTLFFMKCTQGQTYNSNSNSCIGSPITVQFCNTNINNNNSCNGNDRNLLVSSGPLYNSCNGINFAGKNQWRVPTKNELKLLINCSSQYQLPNDYFSCSNYTTPAINSLFPGLFSGLYPYYIISEAYWSANTVIEDSSSPAWYVDFLDGRVYYGFKTGYTSKYVRCVTN